MSKCSGRNKKECEQVSRRNHSLCSGCYIKSLEEKIVEFKDDSRMLCALHSVGVDNWEGYEDALEAYNERM